MRRNDSRRSPWTAALAVLAVLSSACTGDTAPIVEPRLAASRSAVAAAVISTTAQKPDTVRCEIAQLQQNGTYSDIIARFRLGPEFLNTSGEHVKFAVRNWSANSSDPSRVVACEIPNTPAALQRFQAIFGVSSGEPTSDRTYVRGVQATALGPLIDKPSASSRSTDSTARVFDETTCIIADGCSSCPDGAISCDSGTGEWEGPGPSDSDLPSYSVSGTDESLTQVVCFGQTDSPHQSGTTGYFGNVNVHGSTTCPIPLPISVSTDLDRQRCIWFICWWSGVGSGFNSLLGTFVSDNAAGGCAKGYWRGTSYHTVLFPSGFIGSGTSRGVSYISFCF
jgi:hypothetical protein